MAIFRGDGGAGDSNTDATYSLVTTQAVIASTKASEAALSASNASSSASTATTKANEASASATAAANSASSVGDAETNSSNSATASANSATASANSATAAASSATDASNTLAASALKASNLSDLASASTARSNLGLGTAATTASGAYATAAQGSKADSALQSNSTLNVDNMPLDDTNLVVVDTTDLQTFVEGVDHAILKDRGTGVYTTYVSTVAVGGTTFAQPAVYGEISSDQGYFDIHYTGATGITVATLSATSTYVYIDKDGALQQQTTLPTRQDWSRKLFTMRIGVNTTTGKIIGFEYLNNPTGNYSNSLRDVYAYLLAQGIPFKKDQAVTGRSGDLGFDVSAGTLLEFGGTGDINNPNIRTFDAVTNATYSLKSRTATVSSETNLVKYWDNNGTITAIGSTTLVGHRLYRFSNGNFAMQYGQGNYANITLAKAGVLLEDYVLNPTLQNATFFGWWFIESTATNTGGTTVTDFVEYTIGVQGGSSSSLSGALLKGNNLSDLLNAGTARTNLGLGTVATTAADAYATATQGTKADNALVASTVSTFGASVIDDANAGAARTTLGLGTVATTAASAYATATQGSKADSALQATSTINADKITTGTLNGGTY